MTVSMKPTTEFSLQTVSPKLSARSFSFVFPPSYEQENSLSDLLLFQLDQVPGVPIDDLSEVSN